MTSDTKTEYPATERRLRRQYDPPSQRIEWRYDPSDERASAAMGLVPSGAATPFLIVTTSAGVEHAVELTADQALAFEREPR